MRNLKPPKISIIIAVKDCEMYISECIQSILDQSFTDYEALVFDNGSTDQTLSSLLKFNDPRIKVFTDYSLGYVEILNKGIELARGKFIARMDADDIMAVNRLQIQYDLLTQNPNLTLCSSWMRGFGDTNDENGYSGLTGVISNPLITMILGNPVYHPTVLIRKQFLTSHGLKYKHYEYAEDYKFWTDIAKLDGVFYVLPHRLVNYRVSKNQISEKKKVEMEVQSRKIQNEIIEYLIGLPIFKKDRVRLRLKYSELKKQTDNNVISFSNLQILFFDIFSFLSKG